MLASAALTLLVAGLTTGDLTLSSSVRTEARGGVNPGQPNARSFPTFDVHVRPYLGLTGTWKHGSSFIRYNPDISYRAVAFAGQEVRANLDLDQFFQAHSVQLGHTQRLDKRWTLSGSFTGGYDQIDYAFARISYLIEQSAAIESGTAAPGTGTPGTDQELLLCPESDQINDICPPIQVVRAGGSLSLIRRLKRNSELTFNTNLAYTTPLFPERPVPGNASFEPPELYAERFDATFGSRLRWVLSTDQELDINAHGGLLRARGGPITVPARDPSDPELEACYADDGICDATDANFFTIKRALHPDRRFETFGASVGWKKTFRGRGSFEARAGFAAGRSVDLKTDTPTISPALIPSPTLGVNGALLVAKIRRTQISATFAASVNGAIDVTLGRFQPRAAFTTGIGVAVAPDLTFGATIGFATPVDIFSTAQSTRPDETVLQLSIPVTYRLTDKQNLELGFRYSTRAARIGDPNFKWGQELALAHVAYNITLF